MRWARAVRCTEPATIDDARAARVTRAAFCHRTPEPDGMRLAWRLDGCAFPPPLWGRERREWCYRPNLIQPVTAQFYAQPRDRSPPVASPTRATEVDRGGR